MIEINLLPDDMKQKVVKKTGFKPDISALDLKSLPLFKIGAVAIGLFVLLNAVLFMSLVGLKNRKKAMEAVSLKLAPQKQLADTLKSQAQQINRKIASIDELMVKRFRWAQKLNELSNSMIPGIWLSALSYDEKIGERQARPSSSDKNKKAAASSERTLLRYLVLTGYASSKGEEGTALIGKFIQNLKDNKDFYSDFSDVELGSIKSDKYDAQEVMSFRITCLFK